MDHPFVNELGPSRHLLGVLAPRLLQFAAVAREEHVTRAADLLGVPQPTLSRTIARVEAESGLPLFTRRGRSLRLTRQGRGLLEAVERALAELARGVAEVVEDADPEAGKVVLAFLHTLGPEVVPRLLGEFRSSRPRVRFDLVQDSHEVMASRLRAGEIDLCLTSPPISEPQIVSEPMVEQPLVLVVPRGHGLASRAQVRLAEAAGEPFVGLKPGYGLRRTSDRWCEEAGFQPELAFEGEEIETVRGLVAAGLGVALLPADARRPRSSEVVELPVTEPPATRVIALCWRADRPETLPVRAFREFVLGAVPRLLSGR